MTDSVVETYFLTDPKYDKARTSTKIGINPWNYPMEVAMSEDAPADGENADPTNFVRKLLEAKYGKSYDTESAKADRIENPNPVPADNYGHGWGMRKMQIYNHLAVTEKVMKNPGWNGPLNTSPPNPVTLEDKQRSGTYTDEDTKLLERARSNSLVSKFDIGSIDFSGKSPMSKGYLIRNPITGKLAGTGRRKTKKSKKTRGKSKKSRKTRRNRKVRYI